MAPTTLSVDSDYQALARATWVTVERLRVALASASSAPTASVRLVDVDICGDDRSLLVGEEMRLPCITSTVVSKFAAA